MTVTPSDVVLIVAAVLVALFALDYGFRSPWYKDPLGISVLLANLGMGGTLFLIVYALVFDQRVAEPVRFLVALVVAFGAAGKFAMLQVTRHQGWRTRNTPTPDKKEDTNDHTDAPRR